MPDSILVDTSAWIEALRPEGDKAVRQRVRAVIEDGTAVFCDMVRLELWNGARGEQEQSYLRALEQDLNNLPTTEEVWDRVRELARECRRSGLTVPATDLLVIACADHHGAEILHRDKHFEQVREVSSTR